MIDVVEVLVHWHAGRKMGELCSSLGVDPKTVRKYVAPALAAGMVPGGPPLSEAVWSGLVEDWFPELVDHSLRRTSWPEIEPHRERVRAWLGVVTVSTIHQRLRDDHGLAVSESSLRRYIAATFAEEAARGAVRVLRDTPPPGTEAQVDYGLLGRWTDPQSGRTRRVWGFLMVLTFSRLLFLRPVIVMDEAAWVECHVAAFGFFGGVPRRVVPDNLKTGVVRPDLYDPKVNRAFSDLATHYGVLIDPARVRKPRDKARVERPVPYARDSFFCGRETEFATLAAMQADAVRWSAEVANQRQSRALDRLRPAAVFSAEEREALGSLPPVPFELCRWSTRKVGPDIHVKVGKALYSVPWRHLGKEVEVKEGARTVEVFCDGVLVKAHPRRESGKQTDAGDYPPEKIAFFVRTPAWCARQAGQIGPAAARVVADLLAVPALYRLRAAQGVVALADRHGETRLEAACRRALSAGDPSYKTIKGILDAGTEEEDERPADGAAAVPAHLHGPAQLLDLEVAQ